MASAPCISAACQMSAASRLAPKRVIVTAASIWLACVRSGRWMRRLWFLHRLPGGGFSMGNAAQRGAQLGKRHTNGAAAPGSRKRKTFLVELIKPSHYDDDGYVIQWWRGWIPSNSLSCLYGLALDARRAACLATMSTSRLRRTTKPTRWSARAHHPPLSARTSPAWSAWSVYKATSFPARWTSRGHCAAMASRS